MGAENPGGRPWLLERGWEGFGLVAAAFEGGCESKSAVLEGEIVGWFRNDFRGR